MAHDFKAWPELTNGQMTIYYFESPHQQITENFTARVVKVHDGDTIRVETDFRDFSFPIRFSRLSAPELNQEGGHESQRWLESKILGEEVDVILSKQRVEKWGRILGDVIFMGDSMSDAAIREGFGTDWEQRNNKGYMDLNRELAKVA
ncbi:MAG TPA: hypothetical protein ENI23_01905 [bacterium]|nr:hypothetical protein [bacterium]